MAEDTTNEATGSAVGPDIIQAAEKEVADEFVRIDGKDMLNSSKDLAKIRILDDKLYWFKSQLQQDEAALAKLQRGGVLNLYNKGDLASIPISVETVLNKILEGMEFALGRGIEDIGEKFNPMNALSSLQEMVMEFSEKLVPLMEVPSIPELPIIGDINGYIDSMIAMGNMVSKMTPEEISANQKNKDHKWYQIPPEIKETINDIRQDIKSIVSQMPMLLINFLISAVKTLWNLVKKIMDILGLSDAAFPLNLIDQADQLATAAWNMIKDLEAMIERIIRGLIQKFVALYDYAFGPSIDDKFMIDKLSSEIEQLKIVTTDETIIEPIPGCEDKEKVTLYGYPHRIKGLREEFATHLKAEKANAKEASEKAIQSSWLGRNTVGALNSAMKNADAAIQLADTASKAPEGVAEAAALLAKGDVQGAVAKAKEIAKNMTPEQVQEVAKTVMDQGASKEDTSAVLAAIQSGSFSEAVSAAAKAGISLPSPSKQSFTFSYSAGKAAAT